jgi:hypothetical protein
LLNHVLSSLDLSDSDETSSMLDDCVGDKQGSLRLSLSSDDCRFGFLLLHHDKVLSFLCVLLSNLLLLNGLSKLIGELQVGD